MQQQNGKEDKKAALGAEAQPPVLYDIEKIKAYLAAFKAFELDQVPSTSSTSAPPTNLYDMTPYEALASDSTYTSGDCLFTAVAQFCQPRTAAELRAELITYLRDHPEAEAFRLQIEDYAASGQEKLRVAHGTRQVKDTTYLNTAEYLQYMGQQGTWGSALEIAILAYHLKRPIVLMTPGNEWDQVFENPDVAGSPTPIFIYYVNYDHYQPLELPDTHPDGGISLLTTIKADIQKRQAASATNTPAQPVNPGPSQRPDYLQTADELFRAVNIPESKMFEANKEKYKNIVYDPDTRMKGVIQEDGTAEWTKGEATDFVTRTNASGKQEHGLQAIEVAAVRDERVKEMIESGYMVPDAQGSLCMPCVAHGGYVPLDSGESDHVQPRSELLTRQKALVHQLNADPELSKFLFEDAKTKDLMNDFFKTVKKKISVSDGSGGGEKEDEGTYYGTVFFYKVYSNDLDNIWMICNACNRKKGKQETLDWFKKQEGYGSEFIEHLEELDYKDGTIRKSVKFGGVEQGIAQAAINWYYTKHKIYSEAMKGVKKVEVAASHAANEADELMLQGKEPEANRTAAFISGLLCMNQDFLSSTTRKLMFDSEGRPLSPDSVKKAFSHPNIQARILDTIEEGARAIKKMKQQQDQSSIVNDPTQASSTTTTDQTPDDKGMDTSYNTPSP